MRRQITFIFSSFLLGQVTISLDSSNPSAVIQSTNYPNKYPNGHKQEWAITAPSGSTIEVVFSRFHVNSKIP